MPINYRKFTKSDNKSLEINTRMEGDVVFNENVDLKISCRFKGSLTLNGTLTIAKMAVVEADIKSDNVIIYGRCRGSVTAANMLVLMPGASLTGNISAVKLNIVEGAVFQGHCHMKDDTRHELLDIKEVSKYLEIDMKEIEHLANSGKIPGKRKGNSWKFERDQIDLWASAGKLG